MKVFVKSVLAIILLTQITKADIIKPTPSLNPIDVLAIQLNSLKNNNIPYKDAGIEQTWEFAHPNNKKFTGPLEKFKIMLNGESYKMLLNHLDHNITQVKITDSSAAYEVTVLDKGKNYYKFRWIVEKYDLEGPLKDCWLTTGVSPPVSLGSSI